MDATKLIRKIKLIARIANDLKCEGEHLRRDGYLDAAIEINRAVNCLDSAKEQLERRM